MRTHGLRTALSRLSAQQELTRALADAGRRRRADWEQRLAARGASFNARTPKLADGAQDAERTRRDCRVSTALPTEEVSRSRIG